MFSEEEFTFAVRVVSVEYAKLYRERSRRAPAGVSEQAMDYVHIEACTRQILEVGADPAEWVMAQFDAGARLPKPMHLAGPAALERYRTYRIALGVEDPPAEPDTDGHEFTVQEVALAYEAMRRDVDESGYKMHGEISPDHQSWRHFLRARDTIEQLGTSPMEYCRTVLQAANRTVYATALSSPWAVGLFTEFVGKVRSEPLVTQDEIRDIYRKRIRRAYPEIAEEQVDRLLMMLNWETRDES